MMKGILLALVVADFAYAGPPFVGVAIDYPPTGAVIAEVVPEGPAAKAGLKAGDVVVSFNGRPLGVDSRVETALQNAKPGDQIPVVVRRNGKDETIKVTLGDADKAPAEFFRGRQMLKPPGEEFAPPGMLPTSGPKLGVSVLDISPIIRQQYGLGNVRGAFVADVLPGSPSAAAGVLRGDVITSIDDKPVASSVEVRQMVASAKVDSTHTLKLQRGGKAVDVKVTLKEIASMPGPVSLPPTQAAPPLTPVPLPATDPTLKLNALDTKIEDLNRKVDQLNKKVDDLQRRLDALETKAGASPAESPKGPPKRSFSK